MLVLKTKFTQGQYDLTLRSTENNERYIAVKWLTFLAGNSRKSLIINQLKKKSEDFNPELVIASKIHIYNKWAHA